MDKYIQAILKDKIKDLDSRLQTSEECLARRKGEVSSLEGHIKLCKEEITILQEALIKGG